MKQSEGFTSKQREYKRLLKEGETITRSTDREGNCYFDQLDQGDYEITEIKTVMGQTLLKDPIKFSIPFKMSEDEANEYGDVNYESAREDNALADVNNPQILTKEQCEKYHVTVLDNGATISKRDMHELFHHPWIDEMQKQKIMERRKGININIIYDDEEKEDDMEY